MSEPAPLHSPTQLALEHITFGMAALLSELDTQREMLARMTQLCAALCARAGLSGTVTLSCAELDAARPFKTRLLDGQFEITFAKDERGAGVVAARRRTASSRPPPR